MIIAKNKDNSSMAYVLDTNEKVAMTETLKFMNLNPDDFNLSSSPIPENEDTFPKLLTVKVWNDKIVEVNMSQNAVF